MKVHIPRWSVYRPDEADDRRFHLTDGRVVSAAAAHVVVLEGPNTSWEPHAQRLAALFSASGASGFCAITSWWGYTPHAAVTFREVFAEATTCIVDATQAVALGMAAPDLVNKVLRLQSALEVNASGLWVFGAFTVAPSAEAVADVLRLETSPVYTVASLLPSMGCAVCIDDGMDVIFCKLSNRTARLLADLQATLGAVPARPSTGKPRADR